jgi:pimeloyl-ACP methyl ester carboxylesterase
MSMEPPRSPSRPLPTLVLVHGAWADGSSWSEVIARVQAAGLAVVSVQNPLTSLVDDVASVRRALERVNGPVVLAGHSWGGTVITQAGDVPQVIGLVYVAAFAPDIGESTNRVQAAYPPPDYLPLLWMDSGGFLHFPPADLPRFFAQDLPSANANVLAATQGPIRASAFDEAVTQAAWRSKPSWYLLAEHDRMIPPALQRDMAGRMGARVQSVSSSHVPFATRPRETAAILVEAVHATAASHATTASD